MMKIKFAHKLFIIFSSLIIFYTIFLVFYDTHGYAVFIAEDGFVEYGSSLCWLFSTLIILIFYFKDKRVRFKKNGSFYLFLILIFFVFCGEEISWGQRIFGLRTPEYLSEINVQNEITLHNIGHISIFSNLFFIGNIVFFYFLDAIVTRFEYLKNNFDILLPSRNSVIFFTICLMVWITVGVRFGTLGFHPYSFYAEKYYTQMDDEIFEFLSAVSFFYYSLFDVFWGKK